MHPADTFLAALGKDRATYQVFPDSETAARERPKILHGPHRAVARGLSAANNRGMGVFVMVNHGDLQGRKAENVMSVAAYFADFDGAPLPDVWPIDPTLLVESSPGKFHAYWRVDSAPLDEFTRVQAHLALLFGSDEKVTDLPRVMRLPGYQHQKAEPFETRILHQRDAIVQHEAFVEAIALPQPKVKLPEACMAYKRMHQRRKTKVPKRDPLETAIEKVRTAGEGTRNDTLFRIASAVANDVQAGKVQRADAETALTQAARDAGLPDFEIARTLQSAMRYAQ